MQARLVPESAIERELAKRARESLAAFVKLAWDIIEPSTPLVWNWHLDVVCDHVQALLEGRLAKQNLIINVPPGSMKSTIVSVCAPAWVWAQPQGQGRLGPGWRGLFAAGNDPLALRDSMKCRDILDSDWYRRLFKPTWGFAKDQNAKGFYRNSAKGFRKAFSSGARVTGDRGDDIFVDDPLDAAEAFSKPSREAVKNWWDHAYANRLNNMMTGHRCIIMQRLHEDDLVGHVLAQDPGAWEVLCIRQEYEPKPQKDYGPTSLEWVDPRTQPEELMFPERFPGYVLKGERIRLGSSGYAGQHQQRPAPAEGSIFKRAWIKRYKGNPVDLLDGAELVCQTWDCALKGKDDSDFVVGQVWAKRGANRYLLDQVRDRMTFTQTLPAIRAMTAKWASARAKLVEDAANGPAVIETLKAEIDGIIPIIPSGSKESRGQAVAPYWEAGNVWIPEDAPWVQDFVEELCTFPSSTNDDQVDAMTQFLNWSRPGGTGMEIQMLGSRASAEALEDY